MLILNHEIVVKVVSARMMTPMSLGAIASVKLFPWCHTTPFQLFLTGSSWVPCIWIASGVSPLRGVPGSEWMVEIQL